MDLIKTGLFLKNTRKQRGLTQQEVATAIGISPQAISKWERGENLPDVGYFPDIARIYHIAIDALLKAGEVGEREQVVDLTQVSIPILGTEMFDAIVNVLKQCECLQEFTLGFDFFPYLNNGQKHTVLDLILVKSDGLMVLEELLPFTTTSNRAYILGHVLTQKQYVYLEAMGMFLTNDMKQTVIEALLAAQQFELIQDMIPLFNKRQRGAIVDYALQYTVSEEVLDNFMPFLDKNQQQQIFAITERS